MNLILLGPPGAGKGTQAELLKSEFEIPHISTGDMLRQSLNDNSDFGNKVRKFVESGDLVPDSVIIEVIKLRMEKSDTEKGFILDGFPRTIKQAEDLDVLLKEIRRDIDMVLYFSTSLTTIIERLSGRRVCSDCGANYNLKNMPPKEKGICDICSGRLYQRKDDQEETVRRRIDVYLEKTSVLINYYQSKKILRTVNGNLDAGALNNDLKRFFLEEGLIRSGGRDR